MRNVECGMWNVEGGMWNVECGTNGRCSQSEGKQCGVRIASPFEKHFVSTTPHPHPEQSSPPRSLPSHEEGTSPSLLLTLFSSPLALWEGYGGASLLGMEGAGVRLSPLPFGEVGRGLHTTFWGCPSTNAFTLATAMAMRRSRASRVAHATWGVMKALG